MPEESTHDGFTNYETSTTHLWLNNTEETYRWCRLSASSCREQAPVCAQVREEIWTVGQATRYLLAERIQKYVEAAMPSIETGTLYSDLLDSAISRVNWHEIADEFLGE